MLVVYCALIYLQILTISHVLSTAIQTFLVWPIFFIVFVIVPRVVYHVNTSEEAKILRK